MEKKVAVVAETQVVPAGESSADDSQSAVNIVPGFDSGDMPELRGYSPEELLKVAKTICAGIIRDKEGLGDEVAPKLMELCKGPVNDNGKLIKPGHLAGYVGVIAGELSGNPQQKALKDSRSYYDDYVSSKEKLDTLKAAQTDAVLDVKHIKSLGDEVENKFHQFKRHVWYNLESLTDLVLGSHHGQQNALDPSYKSMVQKIYDAKKLNSQRKIVNLFKRSKTGRIPEESSRWQSKAKNKREKVKSKRLLEEHYRSLPSLMRVEIMNNFEKSFHNLEEKERAEILKSPKSSKLAKLKARYRAWKECITLLEDIELDISMQDVLQKDAKDSFGSEAKKMMSSPLVRSLAQGAIEDTEKNRTSNHRPIARKSIFRLFKHPVFVFPAMALGMFVLGSNFDKLIKVNPDDRASVRKRIMNLPMMVMPKGVTVTEKINPETGEPTIQIILNRDENTTASKDDDPLGDALERVYDSVFVGQPGIGGDIDTDKASEGTTKEVNKIIKGGRLESFGRWIKKKVGLGDDK